MSDQNSVSSDFGEKITEGKATVYLPKNVFYNPVQEFNRDLTINVISEYASILHKEKQSRKSKKAESADVVTAAIHEEKSSDGEEHAIHITTQYEPDDREAGVVYEDGLKILEGLAASGLRSVRFAKEIPGIKSVQANDFSAAAVRCMEENIKQNEIEHLMKTSCDDAAMVMHKARRENANGAFDVIDLDPYGSPCQFLDAAVQSIKHGGLLCITCTDMAILCGNSSEKCFATYGAMSLKSNCCHEIALRIVLRTIDSYANRYSRYIVPLVSASVDFYCRVFVRVYHGAKEAKLSASKSAMIYECTGCTTIHMQPLGGLVESKLANGQTHRKYAPSKGPVVGQLCEHCNSPHHIGGPLWSAPLHDSEFIQKLIQRANRDADKFSTSKRIVGMMTTISEELLDVPFYYKTDALCGVLHLTSPSSVEFRSAVLNAGYRVSSSHAKLKSLKTDAPMFVIWDVLRSWNKLYPVKQSHLIDGTPCASILSRESQTEISFEPHPDAEPSSRKQGLLRYQTNMKNWGPKSRPSKEGLTQNEKKEQNQNKRANKKRKAADSQEDYYKRFECGRFKKEGSCTYGDDCKYRHITPDTTSQTGADESQSV